MKKIKLALSLVAMPMAIGAMQEPGKGINGLLGNGFSEFALEHTDFTKNVQI